MTTFQITLPEPLRQFALERVAELGLDSPDQYFEQLLEEDRLRIRDEYYMEKVQEALASGPLIPVTPGFWDTIADEVEQECRGKVVQ